MNAWANFPLNLVAPSPSSPPDTGLLTNDHLLQVRAELERDDAGFRGLPGTTLKDGWGHVEHTPPEPDRIPGLTELHTVRHNGHGHIPGRREVLAVLGGEFLRSSSGR
jgi:hypothetical protein